jgi:hypothetical protein
LPHNRRSNDPLRLKAQSDRDAELDRALRELGDELLNQEIPERLLRVLRSAAADPRLDQARPPGRDSAEKKVNSRR